MCCELLDQLPGVKGHIPGSTLYTIVKTVVLTHTC